MAPYYPPAPTGGAMAIGGPITSATDGSVLFVGAGGLLGQDNANFFWDNTLKQLTISPDQDKTTILAKLRVHSALADWALLAHFDRPASTDFMVGQSTAGLTYLNSAAGQNINLAVASNAKWQIHGTTFAFLAAVDNSFDIGASGANRPRDLFLSRNMTVGNAITFGGLSGAIQTRGGNNRVTIEAASGSYIGIEGFLAAGATTDADVIIGANVSRTAGWIVRMDNAMVSGGAGSRLWGMMFDGRVMFKVPTTAPADGDLNNGDISYWLDEGASPPSIKAKGKTSGGTVYNLVIANGVSPTIT